MTNLPKILFSIIFKDLLNFTKSTIHFTNSISSYCLSTKIQGRTAESAICFVKANSECTVYAYMSDTNEEPIDENSLRLNDDEALEELAERKRIPQSGPYDS